MEQAETPPVRRWDPIVKLTHWGIVTAVIANAIFTEEGSGWHIWVGYGLAGLLGLRLLWGLIGPAEARFSAFPPSPGRAINHLGDIGRGEVKHHASHNPLGAMMVYAIWAVLLVIIGSGVAMSGPPPADPTAETGERGERAEGAGKAEGGEEEEEEAEEAREGKAKPAVPAAAPKPQLQSARETEAREKAEEREEREERGEREERREALALATPDALASDAAAAMTDPVMASQAAEAAEAGESGEGAEGGEDEGEEMLEEMHEIAVNLLYVLIALHLAGVVFETRRSGKQIVQAMIPGGSRKS